MVKLVRDLTSCYEDVLTIHAEGSLEAQKLSILALADFDRYKAGRETGRTRLKMALVIAILLASLHFLLISNEKME